MPCKPLILYNFYLKRHSYLNFFLSYFYFQKQTDLKCICKQYIILNVQRKKNKVNRTTDAQLCHSSNHLTWFPYQILGGKIVKNVQIDPQNNGDMAETAKRHVVFK